jgi:hypothetical protein
MKGFVVWSNTGHWFQVTDRGFRLTAIKGRRHVFQTRQGAESAADIVARRKRDGAVLTLAVQEVEL